MAASLVRRWLAVCSIVGGVACGGDAAAPRRVVAPVAPAPQPAPGAAPTVVEPSVEPVAESPPPPAPEPVAALPPCPNDPERDEHQRPDHVVQLAELAASMTVVDLGSGNGYFLCRLSRAVGPRGHVIATEIDRTLVRGLKQRVEKEQLANVEVVQAPNNDVGIAAGTADRILVVNVWHHIADRKRYATRIARALSPGGKIVVVDFKPGGRHGSHGIAPERVIAELAAGGIAGAVITEDLPDQYIIVGAVHARG